MWIIFWSYKWFGKHPMFETIGTILINNFGRVIVEIIWDSNIVSTDMTYVSGPLRIRSRGRLRPNRLKHFSYRLETKSLEVILVSLERPERLHNQLYTDMHKQSWYTRSTIQLVFFKRRSARLRRSVCRLKKLQKRFQTIRRLSQTAPDRARYWRSLISKK